MASLASINIIFGVDVKSLSTELQNSVREIKKWGNAMQDVGKSLSVYVTAPLVAAAGASAKFASDFSESQNKVQVSFKDSAAQVEAFAKTTLKSFGIAEGSALDMAALFGDMATSMGIPEQEAARLSTSLVGLAGDLASFKNIGIAQATTALNGVFTGETESLKMLGIVMTEANLQQFALSQGITKNIKDFTQAEKVQLRYAYVMKQTTNAQGDFARTGGGAANQMRVLQEGLKELAVQFGQAILPALTAVIKQVNGMVGWLKELDPQWRNFIVVVGAAAAAVGPLVYGLGTAAKAYASMAQAAYTAAASLAANPLTAAAVALGALATYAVVATSRFTPLTNAVKELDKVMIGANESISKESAELKINLDIAKDETKSKEDRQKAISKLNALSPEYLNNLKLETINTNAAKESIDRYVKSLKGRALYIAASKKFQEAEDKLLNLRAGNSDLIKPSVWQNLGNAFLSAGNAASYAAKNAQTLVNNYITEVKSLEDLQKWLQGIIVANEKFADSQDKSALATSKLNGVISGGLKSGTISYYESQIDGLKKIQNETVTTSVAYQKLQMQIEQYQKLIDAIQGKRAPVTSVIPSGFSSGPKLELSETKKRINQLEADKQKYIELQKAYAEGEPEFKRIQSVIDGLDFTIKLNTDPGAVIKAQGVIATAVDESKAKIAELQIAAELLGNGVADAFASMANRFVDSLGLANDGIQGFFKVLSQTVIKIISTMLAQSLAQSIAGATAAGAATGPASVVTTPAFIAEALAGVFAAFAAIPKFETGGIVGGNSFTGDKLLARVNSGEVILNQKQQQRLLGMINPAVTPADMVVRLMGGFEIDGTKLKLVLDRTDKRDNRIK
ncbi:hypothetical protein [Flavobacterium sp. NRK1]|uniref:hypothetical protein n=1 Tax=Flavobacterium sp. NRK1 TaxID=2954929 RepID=UPI002093C47F|nr:hypothetical protein [Flavobacterium sp. NRK1]MCO6149054.1 hypothetical protein [Flavobacterium sp. NRK1]